jgi:uncharacterized protein
VSAFLTPHGAPDRIVRLALAGEISILHDEWILAEYRSVLARPRFGFDPTDIAIVLTELERWGERVVPTPLDVTLPDADDLAFLELAVTGRADALVTGNARHFRPSTGGHEIPIVTPREALQRMAGGR